MAKIVLAGQTDCPYYAKAELLADTLQRCLPDFRVRKVSVLPDAWQAWVEATCRAHGWDQTRSPLVWRELVEPVGRAALIGGFSDFLEHCQDYYGMTSHMSTEDMLSVAAENVEAKVAATAEEQRRLSLIQPLHLWIAGCLSSTCSILIPSLLSADVFPTVPLVSLHLLDLDGAEEDLQALRVEVEDLALSMIHQVTMHTDVEGAFAEADVVLMLDEWTSTEEDGAEDKKKTLQELAARYREYGRLIDSRANRQVKVIVSGDSFVSLRCSLLADSARSLDIRRFVAVTTQLENEAKCVLAKRLGVAPSDVTDVMVWGNAGGEFYVDLQRAQVFNFDGAIKGPPSFSQEVLKVFHDREWLETHFQHLTRRQRGVVTSKTGRAAAVSAADAILKVLGAWNGARDPQELLSAGVASTGRYDLPEGVVLSVPVTFRDGEWSPVRDVSVGDELKDRLQLCAEQLLQDKQLAVGSQAE